MANLLVLKRSLRQPMNSVNEQFVRALESLGYPGKECHLDTFDTKRKIQAIVSLYTVPERKHRIRECLEQLGSRHSLVSLLFLRYTVEASSGSSGVWECFVENGGLSVLEYGFESSNPKFLDNLMELVMFVLKTQRKCSAVLGKILQRYELIDKRLVYAYLNMDVDRSALMYSVHGGTPVNATCACSLFIKKVLDDILRMDKIVNELDFLLEGTFRMDQLVNREYFKSLEDRFTDKKVFERISGMLSSVNSGQVMFESVGQVDQKSPGSDSFVFSSNAMCERVTPKPEHIQAPLPEVFLECVKSKKAAGGGSERIHTMPLQNRSAGHAQSLPPESRALEMLAGMKLKQERPRFASRVLDCTSRNTLGNVHSPCISSTNSLTPDAVLPQESFTPRSRAPESSGTKKPRFGGGRFGAKAKPKVSTLVSSKSYTGIKWKKATKAQSTMFSRISYEESEKLFELTEFDRFESKQEKAHREKPEKPQSSNVCMDPKKCYALNIALSRVRMDNRELLERIIGQECENENLVKQLIMYFPTSEEIELIRECKDQLSRAEMLFVEVQDPKVFYNSLVALRFKICFSNRKYGCLFEEISSTLKRIVESTELLNLFGALLVVGNVLNSNTFNGNAEGFTLDSLQSFCDDAVLELLSRKISKSRLVEELTGCSYDSGDVCLLRCGVCIETAISEFGEVRGMFSEEVDQQTKERFSVVCMRFDEMVGHYKEAQTYFGESDDSFIAKLERFVRRLRDP